MKKSHFIWILFILFSLIHGPWMHLSAMDSQPGVDWATIVFSFFGTMTGTIFVLSLQLLRKNFESSKIIYKITKFISIFLIFSGTGAAFYSLYAQNFGPSSFFFLVIGLAIFAAFRVCDFARCILENAQR